MALWEETPLGCRDVGWVYFPPTCPEETRRTANTLTPARGDNTMGAALQKVSLEPRLLSNSGRIKGAEGAASSRPSEVQSVSSWKTSERDGADILFTRLFPPQPLCLALSRFLLTQARR